ncbi:MAG: DUF72 domain-containing protein [Anaerolineae bacterium]
MARIYVGTCSWSDHQRFYPDGLPKNEQIGYYAERFPLVELDATFYRMMPKRNFQLWAERTPEGFLFDVKPFRQLTWHDRDKAPTAEAMAAFRESLQPLREAGRLGALNFQFPPWYVFKDANLDYLKRVREGFGTDRIAVEFRHRSWLEGEHVPKVLETLRQHDLALTVVDEPQLGSGSVPTVIEVTKPDLAIVRFHGRNYEQWYARVKTTGERFDYLYSEQELAEWVPKVEQLAERAQEVHLLFNNNAQDYAPRNGRQLRQLLLDSVLREGVVLPRAEERAPEEQREPVPDQA